MSVIQTVSTLVHGVLHTVNAIPVSIGDNDVLATAKTFSTGSTGFYFGDKVNIDGNKYQVTCSIILIGSKPKTDATPNDAAAAAAAALNH